MALPVRQSMLLINSRRIQILRLETSENSGLGSRNVSHGVAEYQNWKSPGKGPRGHQNQLLGMLERKRMVGGMWGPAVHNYDDSLHS